MRLLVIVRLPACVAVQVIGGPWKRIDAASVLLFSFGVISCWSSSVRHFSIRLLGNLHARILYTNSGNFIIINIIIFIVSKLTSDPGLVDSACLELNVQDPGSVFLWLLRAVHLQRCMDKRTKKFYENT